MNTMERDDLNNKLNPAMYRQLFSVQSEEQLSGGGLRGLYGNQTISQIPEEEDESESSSNHDEESILGNDEGEDEDHHMSRIEGNKIGEGREEDEEADEEDDEMNEDEDEVPDDDVGVLHMQEDYFREAKDNLLTDKKGHYTYLLR
jgi:hypothetical protein